MGLVSQILAVQPTISKINRVIIHTNADLDALIRVIFRIEHRLF